MGKYDLREYQKEALRKAYAALDENVSENGETKKLKKFLWQSPTGSGKSRLAVEIIKRALFKGKKVLFLAHRVELLTQPYNKLIEMELLPTQIGIIRGGEKARFNPSAPVQIASIMSLVGRTLPDADIVIVDEAHRVCGDTYAKVISDKKFQDSIIIGLSATPERSDGKPLRSAFQKIIVVAQPMELVEQGWIVEPTIFAPEDSSLPDLSDVATMAGDFNKKQLNRVMSQPHLVGAIPETWLKKAKGLQTMCFAAGIVQSKLIEAAFVAAGVRCKHIDGKTPDGERAQVLTDLAEGRLDVVTNANVFIEGIDVPSIKCVIMARPTKSRTVWLQCLDEKTEVLTKRGFMSVDDIKDDDMVAAFDANEKIYWRKILGKVDRQLQNGEEMFSISSPGTDIRVTGNHRMVVKQRYGKARTLTPWTAIVAEKVAKLTDSYKIPAAGIQHAEGLPLTDDELRFVGWFMSDGSKDKLDRIIIVQAVHQPQLADLRLCLKGCGFSVNEFYRVPKNTSFPNCKVRPQVTFQISYGKIKLRNGRGWSALAPYIDKNLPDTFERITKEQLHVFLEALHLGDGTKQLSPSHKWTRRSYHITTGNKKFADRLQSLCVRRGWKCNVTTTPPRYGTMATQPIYMLHIKDVVWKSIGGTSTKGKKDSNIPLLPCESKAGERVWCVNNDLGTLVIRRNGKVSIVGNSIGRGARPWEDQKFVVLDHTNNNMEFHGHPYDDAAYSLDGRVKKTGGGVKRCPYPGCGAYARMPADVCPFGHPLVDEDAAPRTKRPIRTVAGELVEITKRNMKDETKHAAFDRLWMKAYLDDSSPEAQETWVNAVYRSKFDEEPKWLPPPRPVYSEEKKQKDLNGWLKAASIQRYGIDWVRKKYESKFREPMPMDRMAEDAAPLPATEPKEESQLELPVSIEVEL